MSHKKKLRISFYTAVTLVAAIIAAAAVLVTAVVLISAPGREEGVFVPPPFDSSAVGGMPDVPAELGYCCIHREGMTFSAWVCGNVTLRDGAATVYLTNPPENTVWMKLRLLDTEGQILGETGLIRPGEYVERVALTCEIPLGTEIRMKIMTYEPHTYYSMGAVTLNTRVGE